MVKIVVLAGGLSTERNVSLVTGASVCKALRDKGHRAIFVDMFLGVEATDGELEALFSSDDGLIPDVSIDIAAPDIAAVIASRKDQSRSRLGPNVIKLCQMADFVFLGLHGEDGEDGKIQAVLDLLAIPYSGSDMLGSAMALDKAVTKWVMEREGIRTAPWRDIVYSREDIPKLVGSLSVPCAVKVVDGGSSIGVSLPDTKEQLNAALAELLQYGNHVIVEEKINGREMTVPVLDDKCLDVIEIVPPEGGNFDYVSKYQSGNLAAREICPANIPSAVAQKMKAAALKLHNALGLAVYSRTDFIVDPEGNAWCLEINTLPGMTPASLIPKAAAVAGITYADLCEEIVKLSMNARKCT